MGCWNQTCGISNLAIRAGDPVVLFILEPAKAETLGKGGFCYSDDMFIPGLLHIFGKYNDYGSIEEVEANGNAAIVLADFKARIANSPNRYWIEEDRYDKNSFETIEELINIIERGRLRQKDYSQQEGLMGFVMFHRHIYQTMIEKVSSRIPYGQTRTFGSLQLSRYIDIFSKFKNKPDDIFGLRDEIRGLTNSMSAINMDLFNEALTFYDVNELAELATDHTMIREAMALMRKAWIPQCGQGSQSAEYGLHKALSVSINEHVKNIYKEYEEENILDENEIDGFGEETLFWH